MTQQPPSDQQFEPWYVLGAGAMGCLWAAAMTQHLQDKIALPVTLLLRDNNVLARYPGEITVQHNPAGDQTSTYAVPAMTVTEALSGGVRIKRLLLSCKAQDAKAAMASVAPLLDEQAIIVLLQNGIRFQQQLSQSLPVGSVFCLSTSSGAWLRQPFHTVAAGKGESWLGNLYAEASNSLLTAQRHLLAQLPQSEMNIHIDHTMHQRLWEKLAINCAINGLTVIYNCRNGELLSKQLAREHCEALCQEIILLMHHLPLAPDMPDLWRRVQQVLYATGLNISSTLQDIRHGRQTEIEHLNGYLCELAGQHQLPCPLNQQVLSAVLESARSSQTTRHR